ncbi:MAG TPA: SRPBCC family protein [Blastocatellia bacterium]|nr:SRPBCC family protein [Blastocatellia bacterium]
MKWLIIAGAVVVALIAVVVIIGALLPKRHVVSRKALVHQSPETIWALITETSAWRPSIKSVEVLPDREEHRVWVEEDSHGQKITYERIESVAPRLMVTQIADKSLPFGGTWRYEIEDAGGATRVTITEDGEVYNPVFRFVSRFIMGHSATIETYLKDLGNKFGEQVKIEA